MTRELRIGSACTGYGGLDAGVQSVIGGRVVWHCEYEPPTKQNPKPTQSAARLLSYRYPDIPNHGDVAAVNWLEVEPIDVFTVGFPCQDISSAGRRLGLRPGTRSGVWSYAAYAISKLRPSLVVIENVRGILSTDAHCELEPCPWCLGDDEGRPLRAFGAVCGDLAGLGYVGRWGGLRASDVGAPHGRFRVFICAWPTGDADRFDSERRAAAGFEGQAGPAPGSTPDTNRIRPLRAGRTRNWRRGPTDHGEFVADTDGAGCRPGSWVGERTGTAAVGNSAPFTPHTEGNGRGQGWPQPARILGGFDAAQRSPSPATDTSGLSESDHPWCCYSSGQPFRAFLNTSDRDSAGGPAARAAEMGGGPVVMEWGSYAPAIRRWESALGRPAPAPTLTGPRGGQGLSPIFVEWMMGLPEGWVTGVPGLSRNDQLKILGNGVVPAQASAALSWLLASSSERAA